MEFSRVLNGVMKFINNEIMSSLNPWQELLMRVSMSRVVENANNIKDMIIKNPFFKTFAISDENGNIDVDGLVKDFKNIIAEKGCIEFNVPLFGRFKFVENDVDVLCSYIKGV